jgi:hypothetical protein
VLGDGGGTFVSAANGNPVAFTTAAGEGAAARNWYRANDQKFFAGANGWLEPVIGFTESIATAKTLALKGEIALLGASRTSDSANAGAMGTQGITGIVLNDNTTQMQTAYASYLEARRSPGAGTTHGLEMNILNFGSLVDFEPYASGGTGMTAGVWISSGRGDEPTGTNSTVALGIINNGKRFKRGIVFGSTSLDDSGGFASAISMAKGHQITWFRAAGSAGAIIRSDVTTAGRGQQMLFADQGFYLRTAAEQNLLVVPHAAAPANWIKLVAGAAGSGALVAADGEVNSQLSLSSNGTGEVVVFSQSGGAPQVRIQHVASSNRRIVMGGSNGAAPYIGTDGGDLKLSPTTGIVQLMQAFAGATAPSNFTASARLTIKDSAGTTYYIPVTTSTW